MDNSKKFSNPFIEKVFGSQVLCCALIEMVMICKFFSVRHSMVVAKVDKLKTDIIDDYARDYKKYEIPPS